MLIIYLSTLDIKAEQIKMAGIYEQYKFMMLHYALSITKDQQLAEDAVHNAFEAIIKHKDKIFSLSGKSLRNQIIIITKHKCIDLLRKRNNLAENQIDDIEYLLKSNETPLEEQIILNETYAALRKCLAKLDITSQLILEMKYILGMTYQEIGIELNMTPKYVDTKIMRAKAKVRKLALGGEPIE